MSRRATLPSALLIALLWALPASAAPASLTFDAVALAGWRTASDFSDRAPGFQAVGGGGGIFLGISWLGFGPTLGGRARAGQVRGVDFIEAAGDLALQMQLGERVRLRLGGEGGAAWLGTASAPFAGGFLEGLFDVVQLGGGRAAIVFDLRIDIDRYLTSDDRFPLVSTEVGAGFGVRY